MQPPTVPLEVLRNTPGQQWGKASIQPPRVSVLALPCLSSCVIVSSGSTAALTATWDQPQHHSWALLQRRQFFHPAVTFN